MSTGSFGVWAMRAGDFHAREFAGTSTGISEAYAYCGSNGVVTVFPGSTGLTIPTPPTGVILVRYEGGVVTTFGPGGGSPRIGFSPRAYGAKGDDATDDYAALQAAADLAAAEGGDLFLEPGIYRTNLPIKLANKVGIMGSGREATRIKGTDSNQDIIRLQDTMHHVSRLGIQGTAEAGTGIGIRHTGENAVGTKINVGNIVIDEVEIVATSSWGIDLRGGNDAAYEIWETTLRNVIVRSSISGGSFQYGVGSSSPSLFCFGCNFSSKGFGTYGDQPMDRGGVHLDTVTQAMFTDCLWEPTNAVALSLLTCNTVVVKGGKMTMFTEGGTGPGDPLGTDSGKYFITTSGGNTGFIVDGMEFLRISSLVGPRLIKTDDNSGAGPANRAMRLANVVVDTNFVTQSIEDVYLGSADDELIVDNVVVIPTDTGIPRPLTVWNNSSALDRRRITRSSISLPFGTHDKGHLTLGGRHLFIDGSQHLRTRWFNDSTATTHPTTATDGDIVEIANAYTTLEDTTGPSVAGGRNFKAAMTTPRTVTTFPGGIDGQTIRIIFTNANTVTINNGGNFRLLGAGTFTSSTNDVLMLTYDGGVWYEVSRSVN